VSVSPVHCGKTADQIWMPFGMVGWMGTGMRQVVGFGDRSTVNAFDSYAPPHRYVLVILLLM